LDWTRRPFFFNKGNDGASHAVELSVHLTAMKATKVWDHSAGASASAVLGDVQILDNGNRLITFYGPPPTR
jgi:hypothetical protein